MVPKARAQIKKGRMTKDGTRFITSQQLRGKEWWMH